MSVVLYTRTRSVLCNVAQRRSLIKSVLICLGGNGGRALWSRAPKNKKKEEISSQSLIKICPGSTHRSDTIRLQAKKCH